MLGWYSLIETYIYWFEASLTKLINTDYMTRHAVPQTERDKDTGKHKTLVKSRRAHALVCRES